MAKRNLETVELDSEAVKFARDVSRLPDHVQRAICLLMRLYLERKVNPSAEITAEIKRVTAAIDERRFDDLDAPPVLPH